MNVCVWRIKTKFWANNKPNEHNVPSGAKLSPNKWIKTTTTKNKLCSFIYYIICICVNEKYYTLNLIITFSNAKNLATQTIWRYILLTYRFIWIRMYALKVNGRENMKGLPITTWKLFFKLIANYLIYPKYDIFRPPKHFNFFRKSNILQRENHNQFPETNKIVLITISRKLLTSEKHFKKMIFIKLNIEWLLIFYWDPLV